MRVFAQLRALAAFPRRNLPFLQTLEDHDLVVAIGHYQVLGTPLTLKQLLTQGIGSVATVQRRLQRLKRLGVVQQRPSETDRRAVELTLSPACVKAFGQLGALMPGASAAPPTGDRLGKSQARHLCMLCDGEAECREEAVRFLKEGLRQKQVCLLIGSQGFRDATLAQLDRTVRKPLAADQLLHFGGGKTPTAILESVHRILQDAHAAGKTVRGVDNMSWSQGKLDFDSLMDYEARVDPLLRRFQAQAICQYDVRRFAGPQLLRALRSHPDASRYPLPGDAISRPSRRSR
jgi:DNA-binding MarR family transcriptional regulator